MRFAIIVLVSFLAAASAYGQIPKLSAEQGQRFKRDLGYLEKTFFDDQRKGDQFGKHFWRESKRVADRSGPDILPAVVDYCRKWQGEEPLIFVPVVALLPREKSLAVLHAMEHSRNAAYRGFAQEFLTEFEMPDTKAAVEHYSRSKN